MNNDVAKIRARLGRKGITQAPKAFLDTGSPDLNAVLGHPINGIPYGKLVEISGMPSNGKTTLLLDLCAIAQQDGAHVIYADFETSFDEQWAATRGVKVGEKDPFSLLQPYVVEVTNTKGKPTGKRRLVFGEELIDEMNELVDYYGEKHVPKMLVAIDSISGILPEEVQDTKAGDLGFKANMSLPTLLGIQVKKWVGKAAGYNALYVMINQIRTKPMSFGDPRYTIGGNAIPFYAHVRARVNRQTKKNIKSGKTGKLIGVGGELENFKNKVGGIETQKCGYKFYNSGTSKFYNTDK